MHIALRLNGQVELIVAASVPVRFFPPTKAPFVNIEITTQEPLPTLAALKISRFRFITTDEGAVFLTFHKLPMNSTS